jgi:hypothetical protein
MHISSEGLHRVKIQSHMSHLLGCKISGIPSEGCICLFWLVGRLSWLKGQCHKFFCFWFFSWISFPPAPEYPIRTVSNILENSRKYSQVKAHHWYQRHWRQILPQVSLVLLIPVANLPPVSMMPAANLPLVSTTPVANLPPVSVTPVANNGNNIRLLRHLNWPWRQKCIYKLTLLLKCVQTKLLKLLWLKMFPICHRCGAPSTANISANFQKNLKPP